MFKCLFLPRFISIPAFRQNITWSNMQRYNKGVCNLNLTTIPYLFWISCINCNVSLSRLTSFTYKERSYNKTWQINLNFSNNTKILRWKHDTLKTAYNKFTLMNVIFQCTSQLQHLQKLRKVPKTAQHVPKWQIVDALSMGICQVIIWKAWPRTIVGNMLGECHTHCT
jgi:hypothetical protein